MRILRDGDKHIEWWITASKDEESDVISKVNSLDGFDEEHAHALLTEFRVGSHTGHAFACYKVRVRRTATKLEW